MTSAHDVAREIRSRLTGAGDVKVHKLLYYCQGWHLARYGDRAFAEQVEAWANGPVIAELWRAEKHGEPVPAPSPLPATVDVTLDYVIERYGHMTGADLIHLTHNESPWREVSELASFDQRIPDDAMRAFFVEDDLVRTARLAAFKEDRRSTVSHKAWREEIARQIEDRDPAAGLDEQGIRELFRA